MSRVSENKEVMKITKRKSSCFDCKAYYDFPHRFCSLGYPTETKESVGGSINLYPVEPCPKPKTNDEWYEMNRNREKWGYRKG